MGAQGGKQTRVLIIHQNFPGQFRHIAQHLTGRADVEVIGLGRETAPGLPDVKWFRYKLHRQVKSETHPYLRQMESAVLHGQAVARAMQALKRKGFVPDVILAHPGWGETLYAKEVFPQARLIHFCEWYYSTTGADFGFDPEFPPTLDDHLRITTWNALHPLNLQNCDVAISPTEWQKSRHPQEYHHKIQVIHEGVDTENLGPDPSATLTLPNGQICKAGEPIITYVARNLEPYRGFHVFMRAPPQVLREHPTGVKRCCANLALCLGIICLASASLARCPTTLTNRSFKSQRHTSTSLSTTTSVREVIRDGENGSLVPFFDQGRLGMNMIGALIIHSVFNLCAVRHEMLRKDIAAL